jgi:hypothetical protein
MRDQVEVMTGFGVPQLAIAQALGVDAKTLRRYYRDELDAGAVRADFAVAKALFRAATGSGPQSLSAAIFWLKCRAGWTDA